MILEAGLAKLGAKLTWATIRTALTVLLLVFVSTFAYCSWEGVKKDRAELATLKEYKASVETRDEVTAGLRSDFQTQIDKQAKTAAGINAQRLIIENRTAEVAREDQATADFLATPLPERLLQADREARLTR